MRVICRTVEAFVQNLRVGEAVLNKTVWVDEVSREVSAHKILHNLQASAVVYLEGGGEFLLQCGEDVGFDYMDGEPEVEGQKAMSHRKGHLEQCCKDMGLMIRPGIVTE